MADYEQNNFHHNDPSLIQTMISDSSNESIIDERSFWAPYDNTFISLNNVTAVELKNPMIVILDQPVEKFRFRYKSEMLGAHGSLASANSITKKKRHAPTVQLKNFEGAAIIRCTIVTKNEENRIPHAHHLVKREGNIETDRPYEVEVSSKNDWIATFHGMGIIHTAKKYIKDELIKKMRAEALEKSRLKNPSLISLSVREETKIKMDAENAQKWIDLNSVALCFQAFVPNIHGVMCPITTPVYSHSINNLKSALTGELKICRIDKYASSCDGGDEIFLLVEKVGKKNIKIRFFELDDKNNEIWSAYGRFSELDVHHQYAIVFRTPVYKDRGITSPREVFIQLERPTDGDFSEPIKFIYKPSNNLSQRKRPRLSDLENVEWNNQISSNAKGTNNISAMPSITNTSNDLSAEIKKLAFDKCDSNEFKNFLETTELDEYLHTVIHSPVESFDIDLCIDGKSLKNEQIPAHHQKSSLNFAPKTSEQLKMDQNKIQQNLKEISNKVTSHCDVPLHSTLHQGKTPLHYAVMLNQPDIICSLLAYGANVNACDSHGVYVLHEAVKEEDAWECVKALLKAKVNIEQRNDIGWTALHEAAGAGSLRAIDLLIKAGANINDREKSYGRTALHIAVERSHINIVYYLLKNTNININLTNLGGSSALDIASVNSGSNAKVIYDLLIKHGANLCNSNDTGEHRFTLNKKNERDIENDSLKKQALYNFTSDNDEIDSKLNKIDKCENIQTSSKCGVNMETRKTRGEKSITKLLDPNQLTILSRLLEKNNGWKQLAKSIGHDHLCISLDVPGANPALTILNFADIEGSFTAQRLLNLLLELQEIEAATFVQNIIEDYPTCL